MAATVSDLMLDRLTERSVERIYGYPGDGINASSARSPVPRTASTSFKCRPRRSRTAKPAPRAPGNSTGERRP
jgi:hypothetical protein